MPANNTPAKPVRFLPPLPRHRPLVALASLSQSMPGKVEDLAEEAFTKAPPNRPLQALIVAFFVLPQLVLYSYEKDDSAYAELGAPLDPDLQPGAWPPALNLTHSPAPHLQPCAWPPSPAPELLGALLKPAALLKSWQRWLQDEKFLVTLVLLQPSP